MDDTSHESQDTWGGVQANTTMIRCSFCLLRDEEAGGCNSKKAIAWNAVMVTLLSDVASWDDVVDEICILIYALPHWCSGFDLEMARVTNDKRSRIFCQHTAVLTRRHYYTSGLMFRKLSKVGSNFELRSIGTHYRHTLTSFTMKNVGTWTLKKTLDNLSKLCIHSLVKTNCNSA